MSDEAEYYRISGRLGDLELEVEGQDPEWVEEKFEDAWDKRLDEANEMKEAIRMADRSAQ